MISLFTFQTFLKFGPLQPINDIDWLKPFPTSLINLVGYMRSSIFHLTTCSKRISGFFGQATTFTKRIACRACLEGSTATKIFILGFHTHHRFSLRVHTVLSRVVEITILEREIISQLGVLRFAAKVFRRKDPKNTNGSDDFNGRMEKP